MVDSIPVDLKIPKRQRADEGVCQVLEAMGRQFFVCPVFSLRRKRIDVASELTDADWQM